MGGRFNPPGIPALYLSTTLETAVVEASQGLPLKLQPLTIVQYEVDCSDIVDLTDAHELKRLNVSTSMLLSGWKGFGVRPLPPTWELTIRLITEQAAGILVPSAAVRASKGARNLVLWDWSDTLPHKVTHIDDEGRLPQPPTAK